MLIEANTWNQDARSGFIAWVDEMQCNNEGLNINGLYKSNKKLQAEVFKVKVYLVCSWVFFSV